MPSIENYLVKLKPFCYLYTILAGFITCTFEEGNGYEKEYIFVDSRGLAWGLVLREGDPFSIESRPYGGSH
jgi:hypothetical protein